MNRLSIQRWPRIKFPAAFVVLAALAADVSEVAGGGVETGKLSGPSYSTPVAFAVGGLMGEGLATLGNRPADIRQSFRVLLTSHQIPVGSETVQKGHSMCPTVSK